MSAAREFNKLVRINSLKQLYHSSIRYQSNPGIDRINSSCFEKNFKEHISVINRKVHNGSYKFSKYKEVLIPKGSHKCPRVISIPTIRDKLVLKVLFATISSSFNMSTPKLHEIIRDISEYIRLEKYDVVIKMDIENFYPSVIHQILLQQIKRKIRKSEILNLIENAIANVTVSNTESSTEEYNQKGLPQGLAISNILANIYMSGIDDHYHNVSSLKYFRFVDDILILCKKENVDQIENDIYKRFESFGLALNEEKTKTMQIAKKFDYLGYSFQGNLLSVRKKSIKNLHESIIKIFTKFQFKYGKDDKNKKYDWLQWTLNLRITGCVFREKKYGWLFFFSQINDVKLLYSLDHFVDKMMIRFKIPSSKIKRKKFVKSYHEIRKNFHNTTYICNMDTMKTHVKKRLLQSLFNLNRKMTSKEIDYHFTRKMFSLVKDLERDLGKLS